MFIKTVVGRNDIIIFVRSCLVEISAYHRKRTFGVQALTITSCDVWPPFWIFDAEGGGGEKEVYTNLLDDWWKGGGREHILLSLPSQWNLIVNKTWRLSSL